MDNTLDESKNFDVQVPEKHAHGYEECDCFMLSYMYIFRINLQMANWRIFFFFESVWK